MKENEVNPETLRIESVPMAKIFLFPNRKIVRVLYKGGLYQENFSNKREEIYRIPVAFASISSQPQPPEDLHTLVNTLGERIPPPLDPEEIFNFALETIFPFIVLEKEENPPSVYLAFGSLWVKIGDTLYPITSINIKQNPRKREILMSISSKPNQGQEPYFIQTKLYRYKLESGVRKPIFEDATRELKTL